MAPISTESLFEVPIGQNGRLLCTRPLQRVYLLTFNSPPDNRLSSSFCQALLLALDILEHRYAPGCVITTSAIPKFYSNGLDLSVFQDPSVAATFLPHDLYALFRRFLTYPMPTVALSPGHAFAGGLMLAMCHDYRFANPHKGMYCLNELELGIPLRPGMMGIFKQKIPAGTVQTMVLEARRYKALDALKEGFVDGLGGLEECLGFVEEQSLAAKAGETYGYLKEEMWKEVCGTLRGYEDEAKELERRDEQRRAEEQQREGRIKAWQEGRLAKL